MIQIADVPPLHPDSAKWYWLQWSADELGTDIITSASWTVPVGLTQEDSAFSGQLSGVKLSVAIPVPQYELEVEITTSGGEILHETMIVRIDPRGH